MMISRVANSLRTIERHWTVRPLWTGALLVLLGMVLIKPWACVAYCALVNQIEQRAAAVDHAHHHGDHTPPATESHSDHTPPGYQPSALTVAIVLPLLLLPFIRTRTLCLPVRSTGYASIAPPLLWRPPRSVNPA